MPDVTLVNGGTTITLRPGNFQVRRIPDRPRQRRLTSTNGTVRLLEVSTVKERFLEVEVVGLPTADAGVYEGRDSLRTFLVTTVNFAESTITLTDADGDAFTVRYWDEEFDLREGKKDNWNGRLLFRVE